MASCVFVGIEYISRTSSVGMPMTLLRVLPLAVSGQIALYYTFQTAPSWLMAWFVFAFGSSALRVAVSHYVAGEPVSWMTVGGVLLMITGGFAIKTG
jgi:hypothetical protein